MIISNPIAWCQEHGWTEPRQLEDGLWVAFPPAGVIETPLPNQLESQELSSKNDKIQDILDLAVLSIITLTMSAIALLMFPFLVAPLIKYYLAEKLEDRSNS